MARHIVWGHIRDTRERFGATILIATHFMDEIDALADRVGVLHRGRFARVGTPRELRPEVSPEATEDDVFAYDRIADLAKALFFRSVDSVKCSKSTANCASAENKSCEGRARRPGAVVGMVADERRRGVFNTDRGRGTSLNVGQGQIRKVVGFRRRACGSSSPDRKGERRGTLLVGIDREDTTGWRHPPSRWR